MPEQEPNENQQENIAGEPLKAVSNVIELKPGHKYLLVFRAVPQQTLRQFGQVLRAKGIDCIGISLHGDEDLEIIEIPEDQP